MTQKVDWCFDCGEHETKCICVKCTYCKNKDNEWDDEDLKRGWRWKNGTKEYHCYSSYCD